MGESSSKLPESERSIDPFQTVADLGMSGKCAVGSLAFPPRFSPQFFQPLFKSASGVRVCDFIARNPFPAAEID